MEADNRLALIQWLKDTTTAELREAGEDRGKQKAAFVRYFLQGDNGQLDWAELWDYLSISDNNPLQRTDLYEDEQLFEITLEIIGEAADEAAQMIREQSLHRTTMVSDSANNEPAT